MPQLLRTNFVRKQETTKFKSHSGGNKNLETNESDTNNESESVEQILLSSFSKIRDDDSNLPLSQRLNEPIVKDTYIKFVEHLSRQSLTSSTPQRSQNESNKSLNFSTFETESNSIKGCQEKKCVDSDISFTQELLNEKQMKQMYLKNRVLEEDELSFMKNFKSTNKKLRVFPSYQSDESFTNIMLKKNNNPVPYTNTRRMQVKESSPVQPDKKRKLFQQQPLSLYEKMVLIQESRNVGLYALCDSCNKARYLPHVKDPLDLPEKWYCSMNPDKSYNKCTDPEQQIPEEEKDYLIENEYNSGSIVWAKISRFPWWPAMVEDDPDYETYFWLKGSLKPVSYHVTMFDSNEVSRVWLSPKALKPFKINMYNSWMRCCSKSYKQFQSRIDVAFAQAVEAVHLPLIDRLRTYSFIERYSKGLNNLAINKSKRCTKQKSRSVKRNKKN